MNITLAFTDHVNKTHYKIVIFHNETLQARYLEFHHYDGSNNNDKSNQFSISKLEISFFIQKMRTISPLLIPQIAKLGTEANDYHDFYVEMMKL